MKKVISYLVVGVAVLVFCFSMMASNRYYTAKGSVTSINGNLVTVQVGMNDFQFEAEATGLKRYQRVKIKMDNNGTNNYIYDDKIVKVEAVK